MQLSHLVILAFAVVGGANAILYPHDVQGPGFLSLLNGQKVSQVRGVLTAKDSAGCFIQTPDANIDNDDRTSEGLYLFRSSACSSYQIGDLIQVDGKVTEYTSGGGVNTTALHLTELTSTANVTLIQGAGNVTASAVVIGGADDPATKRVPPTTGWIGNRDPFALPSGTATLEGGARAKSLDVKSYGADFWESLESTLITIPAPVALSATSSFGEVEIVPQSFPSYSRNSRGGLTLAAREDESSADLRWDANPQAINLVKALDGTTIDANIRLGDVLEDVTGIVGYAFGLYTLSPLTAPKIKQPVGGSIVPSPWTSTGTCDHLLTSTYNVDNLSPDDQDRITKLGGHIDQYLKNPDIIVVNEIQDNDGPRDDAVVNANTTLTDVVSAIKGATYLFSDVDPDNKQDGGQPGGNIRTSFIWRPDHVQLRGGIPKGGPADAVDVVSDVNGKAQLTLNPGRINPSSQAWHDSRKPLVGQFDLLDGSNATIFVIGVHFTSKGGGTGGYQNPQPPINGGVQQRSNQANEVRTFAEKILNVQQDAHIVVLGDFNELSSVQPLNNLTSSGALQEVSVGSRVERYSYVYQQNSQELDHVFVSPAVNRTSPKVFVPHANTWTYFGDRVSDHDPVVARLNVC